MKRKIIIFMLLNFVIYFISSFIAMSLDVRNWELMEDWGGRFCMILVEIGIITITSLIEEYV